MNDRYNLQLLLLGAALAAVTYVLPFAREGELGWFYGALVLNVVLAMIVGRLYKGSVEASNSAFFRRVLGATGIRMLISLTFLAIYLIVSTLKSTHFIGYFLILYLLFTIFEIYQIVSKLRPEK